MPNRKTKAFVRVLAIVLAGMMVFSALISALYMIAAAETEDGPDTSYDIQAVMLSDEQAVRCEQTIVYTNGTDEKLSQLFFTCYANALRRQSLLPYDAADLDAAFPEGYAPGGIQFADVSVNGASADWGMLGDGECFLRVEVALAPGESVSVRLLYDILLPVCSGTIGAGSFDWRLCNAFPTLCPIRDGAFVMNAPLSAGAYACAEEADWSLALTAPDGWEVIASGEQECQSDQDGWTVWRARAENARDMAVVIGRRYTRYTLQTESGLLLAAYTNDRSAAQRALSIAGEVVGIYEDWFGALPFASIDIVQSQYCAGVKSAPGVLLIGRELFALSAREELEYELARALAGQYFGQAVGNDPYNEPWLSESLPAYSALMYLGERYGEARFLRELNERVRPALQLTLPGGVSPASPGSYFNSREEYETCLRGRGAAALYELCDAMGKDAYISALGNYVARNRGQLADFGDFAFALDADGKWDAFLLDALTGIGDYTSQTIDWYE